MTRVRSLAVPAVLAVFAFIVGSHHLGRSSLWFDETFSAHLSQRSWPDFAGNISAYQGNESGYFLLLKLWPGHTGGESGLRMLSVLFTVLAVPLLYGLARDLFDRTVGLLAALIYLLLPLSLHATQEARGYALLGLAAIASVWAFVRATRSDGRLAWVLYALSVAVLAYSHTYGVFVFLAQLSAFRMWWPRRQAMLASLAGAAVLVAPLAVWLSHRRGLGLDFLPPLSLRVLRAAAVDIGGRGSVSVLLLGLTLAGVVLLVRRGRPEAVLLVAWLVLTPALTIAYSVVASSVFQSRYLAGCLPALALLAAVALRALPVPRGVLVPLLVLFVLGLGLNVRGQNGPLVREDWRAAVGQVNVQWQPGDRVRPPVAYEQDGIRAYLSPRVHPAAVTGVPARTWIIGRQSPTAPAGTHLLSRHQYEGVLVSLFGP
ncbi:MAG: glycosyl transferase, family 39 [Frankiales bacterium]|nr:glycosyl transferase, family 39 [Frankiales bacterium]